ncbi:helix-hairpin-helix domain-containing protein [Algoriphagus lutimaris]|uniref:ComEA family DNA-binding protein n=1 Tax=Algoriphagus lutimaris TaxID=613197 RepID=UPI00196B3F9F|nr:helix-hairpin-helix domain-containing protein [Algoriphagus lutimaris]MBN3519968.1 helix-hairpin-helix domain-containing protein [Algoriphagus lutimaris]
MKGTIFYWLKSYLGFSNKESRGFLFLLPFLTILLLIPTLFGYIRDRAAEDYQFQFQLKIDSLRKAGVELVSSPDLVFNPEDTVKNKPVAQDQEFENLKKIPLSEADSATLQIVPGIGPAFASRIIKYREQLGGFHDVSQLSEVYGLTPETIEKLCNYFEFDELVFRKMEINQITESELAKHPYISYSEAKVILAYKKQHGAYQSIEDLKEIKIFKPQWIDKIAPYLAF